MNQKGEVNLFFILIVACLTGVMLLCALELQRSYNLLKKRTHLFLCMKETEGELTRYMKLMGRTNWAIKNTEKAKLIMIFIPGLQAGALEAEKVKRTLTKLQDLTLVLYVKKLAELRSRSCPFDPRLVKTPFHLSGTGYQRKSNGTARLREEKWTNYYIALPYSVSVKWNVSGFESVWPAIRRNSSENGAKLSSILSFY